MRIACPSCHAVYDVPPSLAEGRRVRCARCKTEFSAADGTAPMPVPAAPTPDPAAASPPLAPAIEPMATAPAESESTARLMDPPGGWPEPRLSFERPRTIPPRPARWQAPLALSLSMLIVLAALSAALVWRADIMHAWPPSQRLYQALGMG